ncbi:MAG: cytochrome oxidase subunit III [Gammaproteobacteria bacterium]|nr:cytochrome oxidase subunit III [Gammaproteobacteria bacterium]
MSGKNEERARKFQLWGWYLFLASATFFVIASIRVGDVIGLLGGFFFFAACVVFLLPYYGSKDS